MKKYLLLPIISAAFCTFAAFGQEQPEAPRFNGADVLVFHAPAHRRVRKGRTGEERARRNAFAESRRGVRGPCRRQHRRMAFPRQHVGGTRPLRPCPLRRPPAPTLTEAFSRLGGWSPATYADGRTTDYTLRLTLRIPVEKYLREQDPDPLLFLGEDPGKSFTEWMRERVRYDERFAQGRRYRVREVRHRAGRSYHDRRSSLETPDPKLSKEVIRVIRGSKGKWDAPQGVDGVPQRTAYEYRCNYVNESY